jgi:23S rRNA (pseudouridine1915-N3)-methyltransferase
LESSQRSTLKKVYKNIKMISKYVSIQLEVGKEEKITTGKPVKQILVREGERLLARVSDRDFVVILDSNGDQLSSPAFADLLQKQMLASHRSIFFIIGGPHGLDKAVKKRADLKLSLSSMTFAHELCLIVLLEQIYRAMSIVHGSKYHK